MLERTLTLFILLSATTSFSQWEKVTQRWISAFDMLTPRFGLAAAIDGAPLVMRLDNGKEFGIINPSGTVTTLTIVDLNIAYMTVAGDGVYKSSANWEFWKRIYADPNGKLVGVTSAGVFIQSGKKLYYSPNELAYSAATGIDTVHEIRQVVGFGNKLVAASQSSLYYSSNGGADWTKKVSTLGIGGTLYLDTVAGAVFAGGDPVMVSRDSGKTWSILSTPVYPSTKGYVYGARDCSGTFYIVGELSGSYDFYRSTDHGITLQNVGLGPGKTPAVHHVGILDRGSTLFWLEKDYNLVTRRDGVDRNITDSVVSMLTIRPDTGIVSSACPGGKAVSFSVRVGFPGCTGIRIDNLTIEGNGFATTFIPKTVAGGEVSIPCTYKASKVGYDTARVKVIFRSLTTNNTEIKTASVIGRGVSGPAELSISIDNISFGILDTSELSIKSVTVFNNGCDALRIDSVQSSLPDIFSITGYTFPMYVLGGSRASFNIIFSPQAKQKYLESLELYTSEGIRYVTLSGEGTFETGTGSVGRSTTRVSPIGLVSNIVFSGIELAVTSTLDVEAQAAIYTSFGSFIANIRIEPSSVTNIDVSNLPTGLYVLAAQGQPPQTFYILR